MEPRTPLFGKLLGLSGIYFSIIGYVYADNIPLACNPKEDPAVCLIKVERNTAQDEAAINGANLWREIEARKAVDEYWKSWVEGDIAKATWWDKYIGRLVSKSR